jgi:hypothetical protein
MDLSLVQPLAEFRGEDQRDGVLCRRKFDEAIGLDRIESAFGP